MQTLTPSALYTFSVTALFFPQHSYQDSSWFEECHVSMDCGLDSQDLSPVTQILPTRTLCAFFFYLSPFHCPKLTPGLLNIIQSKSQLYIWLCLMWILSKCFASFENRVRDFLVQEIMVRFQCKPSLSLLCHSGSFLRWSIMWHKDMWMYVVPQLCHYSTCCSVDWCHHLSASVFSSTECGVKCLS